MEMKRLRQHQVLIRPDLGSAPGELNGGAAARKLLAALQSAHFRRLSKFTRRQAGNTLRSKLGGGGGGDGDNNSNEGDSGHSLSLSVTLSAC